MFVSDFLRQNVDAGRPRSYCGDNVVCTLSALILAPSAENKQADKPTVNLQFE